MTDTKQYAGLRLVALLELSKGALVLLAGFGLLSLLHKDFVEAAEDLVELFHLNPDSRMPHLFIDAAARLTDAKLWLLAAGAFAYSLVRAIEAWGLWRHRAWAEWFGALTGAVYIPVEIYELAHKPTWLRFFVLAVNLVVVGYLALELWRRKQAKAQASQPAR